MLRVQVTVLLLAAVAVGLAVVVALLATGAAATGSILFGAQVAGFGTTFVAVTALLCQVLASRGRVVGVAATGLVAAFLVRMVANSSDERDWVAWLTPLGWGDRLAPFGADRWPVLLVPLAVTAAGTAAALLLRGRRDEGAGLVAAGRPPRSRDLWLSGPTAFAWRASLPSLTGWAVGLTVYSGVVGTLLPSMERFLEEDPSYAEMLAAVGIGADDVTGAFLAMMGVIVGVALALHAVWRLGAARAEEESERLDHLLARPVTRVGWLVGHVVLTATGVVLLTALAATATWAAALAVGADLALSDAVAAYANALPAVAVLVGAAVALLGAAPRVLVPVGASLAVVTWLLPLVGRPLDWPGWVVAVSPFDHLALVPVEDVAVTAAVVMTAVGVALGAVGVAAFRARDLTGG